METGYFINKLGFTSLTALEAESPTLTCFIGSPPGENLIAEDYGENMSHRKQSLGQTAEQQRGPVSFSR